VLVPSTPNSWGPKNPAQESFLDAIESRSGHSGAVVIAEKSKAQLLSESADIMYVTHEGEHATPSGGPHTAEVKSIRIDGKYSQKY
jgi:hypothetical protein